MEPFADENDFAWDGGDEVPWEQAEQREVDGKGVHARHAAKAQGDLASAKHARIGHGDAGKFQREVSFDGRVDFGWTAVINVPAAVRQLHGEDVIDGFALPNGIDFPVPMMICDRVETMVESTINSPIQ